MPLLTFSQMAEIELNYKFMACIILLSVTGLIAAVPSTEPSVQSSETIVGLGYSKTAVNTVIFRRNSITSFGDDQYIAYYDPAGSVMLGKRKHGDSSWQVAKTQYKGDVTDAHRSISLAVDGAGFLHLSWDHHNNPLNYCRSIGPGSLELTDRMPMTGENENRVTYPEFYNGPRGTLTFLYRDGSSGNGDLILNQYDPATQKWTRLCRNLIAGEGKRNAYWQACTDSTGTIHMSWVWRESPNVASNHNECYAKSIDGGRTWTRSDGKPYALPIKLADAEIAAHIPPNSDLINSTSMCVDAKGHPFIATYFRPEGGTAPQFQMISNDGTTWRTTEVLDRSLNFTLKGAGTKRVPISRPLVVARNVGQRTEAFLVFRDEERGSKVSMASCPDLGNAGWSVTDLTSDSVEMWEPTYDPIAWQKQNELDLLIQRVGQGDGEKLQPMDPQPVRVLVVKPLGAVSKP